MNEIIISLDIGSSSIRCSPYSIYFESNSVRAVPSCASVRKISSVRPNSGKIILIHQITNKHCGPSSSRSDSELHLSDKECDSESSTKTLFDFIDECIDESLSKLRSEYDRFQIVGLGVSSFVMNFIGIDEKGQLIPTNVDDSGGGGGGHTISYACNSQDVVNECLKLKKELGETELHDMYQRTGTPLHNAYALAQLRVHYERNVGNKNDDNHKKVHQWTTVASYCILRWTGQWKNFRNIPISFSEASWTGMFNFRSCQWDEKCCDLLPSVYRNTLPSVDDYKLKSYQIEQYIDKVDSMSSASSLARVRNPYWDRWPEFHSRDDDDETRKSCRLFLGFGDGVCANVGSKCTSSDRIACTIGTSAAMRRIIPTKKQIQDDFHVPFGLFCYRIDLNHLLIGGALTDGGSIVELLRNLMNLKDDNDFLKCLEEAGDKYKTETDGGNNQKMNSNLCVIPFLSGERSVGFRGGATGCVLGLTRETRSSDLMRSSLESVILRLHQIFKLIKATCEENNKETCIVASGNALECNVVWRQMFSDCLDTKTIIDKEAHEGTSRGAAVLVLQAMDIKNQRNHEKLKIEEIVPEEEQNPRSTSKTYWKENIIMHEKTLEFISKTWI